MKLPEWAVREEIYNPGSDRDYFISRSLLKIVSILTALRGQGLRPARPIGAAPALLAALGPHRPHRHGPDDGLSLGRPGR